MALPTSMTAPAFRGRTGVVLGVYPSTQAFNQRTEIQRSTQATTGTTTWVSSFHDPSSGQFTVVQEIPLSTRSYYWRARHVAIGYLSSPYTPIITAKPVKLDTGLTPLAPVLNKTGTVEVPGDLSVQSTRFVNVGAQSQLAPTTYVTKSVRFTQADFQPDTAATVWNITDVYVHSDVSTATETLWAALTLPPGTTITAVSSRTYFAGGGMAVTCDLYRIESDASTNLGTTNHISIGSWTTDTISITESVTAARHYVLRLQLLGGGTASDARCQYVDVTYRMPSYDKAY